MKTKVFSVVLLLVVIIAFSGCSIDAPETDETTEGETVTGATPTPTIQAPPNTQDSTVGDSEDTLLPEDFKEVEIELRGITIFLSVPRDWALAGSSIYKEKFVGQVSVIGRLHTVSCAENFAECTAKKYPSQNWTEFNLENCNMQAAERVSYDKDESIQRELWVDFPEEKKGILAVCTVFKEKEDTDTCTQIYSSFKC